MYLQRWVTRSSVSLQLQFLHSSWQAHFMSMVVTLASGGAPSHNDTKLPLSETHFHPKETREGMSGLHWRLMRHTPVWKEAHCTRRRSQFCPEEEHISYSYEAKIPHFGLRRHTMAHLRWQNSSLLARFMLLPFVPQSLMTNSSMLAISDELSETSRKMWLAKEQRVLAKFGCCSKTFHADRLPLPTNLNVQDHVHSSWRIQLAFNEPNKLSTILQILW